MMPPRAFLTVILAAGLALGRAWGDPPPSAERGSALAMAPVTAETDSLRLAARRDAVAAAYREHAPLAWFSVGSLAVGGIFYAIGRGIDRPNVTYTAGDRSQLGTAVSVAGASALLAAGSYFYYVHRAQVRADEESGWDAAVSGGPDGAGGLAVSARLTLPLPFPR